jgi:hypothetical protein
MVVARVIFSKLKPNASIDEARKVWTKNITPAMKAQKGFVGNLWLFNEQTREGITISLWQSKSIVDANEKSGFYQKMVMEFAPFIDVQKIEMKVYDVLETTFKL